MFSASTIFALSMLIGDWLLLSAQSSYAVSSEAQCLGPFAPL